MNLGFWKLGLVVSFAAVLGVGCGGNTQSVEGRDGGGDVDSGGIVDMDAARPPGPDANPCELNTCECTVDTECGAHEFCDLSGPGRVCGCVPGYVDSNGACVWGGAPLDPGFQSTDAWTSGGPAFVNTGATGDADPGVGMFFSDAMCSYDSLAQTFEMPPYQSAEPFVVNVSARTRPAESAAPGPAIAINGGWHFFEGSDFFLEHSVCLGARGYGGAVKFEVAAADTVYDCGVLRVLEIDRLSVEVASAGQCPALGEFLNGDFENTNGWAFQANSGGVAEIASGKGETGSSAGHLALANRCSSASMVGTVALPMEEVAWPALELWRDGDISASMFLGGKPLTQVPSGAAGSLRACVPAWARGLAQELRFRVSGGNGNCSVGLTSEFNVDSLKVVSESNCADGFDGGFEFTTAGLLAGWNLISQPSGGVAEIVSDANVARTDSGVLRLTNDGLCQNQKAEAMALVPATSAAGDGPALVFWYRDESSTVSSGRVSLGSAAPLAKGVGWQRAVRCLDPASSGRPASVQISWGSGGGSCATSFAPESLLVDDLQFTTDASCPGA